MQKLAIIFEYRDYLIQLKLVILYVEFFFCTAVFICILAHLFCCILLLWIFYSSSFGCMALNSVYCAEVLTHSLVNIIYKAVYRPTLWQICRSGRFAVTTHSERLPFLSCQPPVFDAVAKHFITYIQRCLDSDCEIVKSIMAYFSAICFTYWLQCSALLQ